MSVEPGLGEAAAEAGVQGFAQKRWEPLGGNRAQHQSQCLCPQKRGLAEPRTGDQIPSQHQATFLSVLGCLPISPSPGVTEDTPQEPDSAQPAISAFPAHLRSVLTLSASVLCPEHSQGNSKIWKYIHCIRMHLPMTIYPKQDQMSFV